jgi:hypothetical protein
VLLPKEGGKGLAGEHAQQGVLLEDVDLVAREEGDADAGASVLSAATPGHEGGL